MPEHADFIASNTTAENAPDRFEVKNIGGVDCHAGLMANTDHANNPVPQQDRMSAYALPGMTSRNFAGVLESTFASMKDCYKGRPKSKGVCVTITMFDPKSGKLAIGSKGDVGVYLVLESKKNPGEILASRVSSPNEEYEIPGDRSLHPISIQADIPVMYAKANDYTIDQPQAIEKPGRLSAIASGLTSSLVSRVPLLDIRELANGIIAKNGKKITDEDAWKDYKLSIITASDGFIYGKEVPNMLVKNAVAQIPPDAPNKAEAMAKYVGVTRPLRSMDNLAVVILDNIEIGKGEPVAVCVADEHSRSKSAPAAAAYSAQKMIDMFEEKIEAAIVQNTPSFEKKFGERTGKHFNR
jgi:hypothetical protein